jgi:hypothetical protein
MQSDCFRHVPLSKSRNPFKCGLTGKTYTHDELFARSEGLARALAEIHQWSSNQDTPWDKVVCIYSLNSVSIFTKIACEVSLIMSPDRLHDSSICYT